MNGYNPYNRNIAEMLQPAGGGYQQKLQVMGNRSASPTPQTQAAAAPRTATASAAPKVMDWRSQMEELGEYQKQLYEELGIPGMRGTVKGLRGQVAETERLLKQLRPDIEARTKDFLTPESYLNRMEAVERAPLVEQLTGLGRTLGVEEESLRGYLGDVDDRMSLASQLMQKSQAAQSRTPTESERSRATTTRLREDIAGGMTFENVMRTYGTELDPEEILRLFNLYSDRPVDMSAEDLWERYRISPGAQWLTGGGGGDTGGMYVDEQGNLHF